MLKRMLIIALIFLTAFIIAVAALIIGVTILIHEIEAFINDLPDLIESSRVTFESLNRQFAVSVPPEVSGIVRDVMQNLGDFLVSAGKRLLVSTIGIVSQTASILLGLFMVPLILFYLLKDRGQIIEGALRTLRPGPRRHTVNIVEILNGVFSAYLRGQILLGSIVGVVIFIGLWLLGIPFSPVLGLIAGLFELIPVIGPWIGAIPGFWSCSPCAREVHLGGVAVSRSAAAAELAARAAHTERVAEPASCDDTSRASSGKRSCRAVGDHTRSAACRRSTLGVPVLRGGMVG